MLLRSMTEPWLLQREGFLQQAGMSFCQEILPSVCLELFMLIFKSISSCFGARGRWGAARRCAFFGLSRMVSIIWDRRSPLPRHLGGLRWGFSVHLGRTWTGGGGSGPPHAQSEHVATCLGAARSPPYLPFPPALPWGHYLTGCHSRFMLWGEGNTLFCISVKLGVHPERVKSLQINIFAALISSLENI